MTFIFSSRSCAITSAFCAAAFLLSACSSEVDDKAEPTGPDAIRANVGSEGGNLQSADGRIRLNVPQGSLRQDIEITVTPVEPPQNSSDVVPGSAFDFKPEGVEFDPPLELEMDYDESEVPAGVAEHELAIHVFENNRWVVENGASIETQANVVRARLTHFSTRAIKKVDATPDSDMGVDDSDMGVDSDMETDDSGLGESDMPQSDMDDTDMAASNSIHVQLTWDANGSDLNLHYLHPNAVSWNDTMWDIHWRNPAGSWGPAVNDPTLDIDVVDGSNPENINHLHPENLTYYVGVDHHSGPSSDATVNIFFDGVLVYSDTRQGLMQGDFWAVAAIDGATGSVEASTDSDGDGVPDAWDNCVNTPNFEQVDSNNNGQGDACDEGE